MKKITWLLIGIIVLIFIGFKLTGNVSSSSIKIGGLYPLTGGLASYGEAAYNTAKIAVEDINSSGGINGKTLELLAQNHQCDPKVALSAFQKLSGIDNVHIFTSVACTGAVMSVIPELQSKDAVLLATVTSGNKLTGISPQFFRNWASDAQEAKLLSDEILKKGYKSVAVIYEETDYAKGLKISMENYLKGTGVVISSESFSSGSTDIRSQLTKLQNLKADAVFVSVQTVTSGEVVLTQMEQLKFKPHALFINDNILKAGSLIKNHSALLEGAIGGDYVISESYASRMVLEKYKLKYGTECPQVNICLAEYDAIKLLAQAMAKNGDSSESVKNYLNSVNYSGVSGSVAFDSNNDRKDAQYSLFVIREGAAQLLK